MNRRLRVVIESPLRGHVPRWAGWLGWLAQLVEWFGRERNRKYAYRCMLDSLGRGEAPYASHLLFDSRQAVLADWGAAADVCAVYADRGISDGMRRGIAAAEAAGRCVVYRWLDSKARRCMQCGKPAVTAYGDDELCAQHADADPRSAAERAALD